MSNIDFHICYLPKLKSMAGAVYLLQGCLGLLVCYSHAQTTVHTHTHTHTQWEIIGLSGVVVGGSIAQHNNLANIGPYRS
jgi:hypothetical protein